MRWCRGSQIALLLLVFVYLEPDDFMSISAANGIENCKLCVVFIFSLIQKKRLHTTYIYLFDVSFLLLFSNFFLIYSKRYS